jgi:hypothetical protein
MTRTTRICSKCGAKTDDPVVTHCKECTAFFERDAKVHTEELCSVPKCPSPIVRHGYCGAHAPKPGTTLYKVVTQRDGFFEGKFDPVRLEGLVNSLAVQGWRVVSVASTDVSTFFGPIWGVRGGSRQELIIFLEKSYD